MPGFGSYSRARIFAAASVTVGFGFGDRLRIDRDRIAVGRLQVVNVRAAHIEALAAPCVGVHLELQRIVERVAIGGGLVVDDRQRGRHATLLVEDHVGATRDRDAVEVQLEGSLGLPNAVQVGLVSLGVGRD